jgi:glyceraldehyde-3-phosphate dehydrogenase (NADP+)
MKTINDFVFPEHRQIPDHAAVDFPYHQTEYLIDGEIRTWKGDFEKVYSPVYILNDGAFDNLIGSYPKMDEDTVLKALESAKRSFGNGQGEWPSMSVELPVSGNL